MMKNRSQSLRRVKLAVWGMVACFVLLLGAGAGYLVWSARQAALSDSHDQALRFLTGAEAALNRSLLGVDVLLAGTDDMLNLSNLVPEWVDAGAAHQLLRNAERQNILVRQLALMDASERVFASSKDVGDKPHVELPKGFMDDVLAQPMSTMVVSAPTVSQETMERVFFIGRYIRMADGTRVVVVAEVPIAMLSAVLMQGTDIPALEVTLERGNGQLLLAFPAQEARPHLVLSPALGSPTTTDTAMLAARLSDQRATVVARHTIYQDLWITASIPVAAALAEWRNDRNAVLGAALVLAVLLVLAGAFAVAYFSRIARARLDIAQAKATLDQALGSMVTGFLLLDTEHRVVQWNRRFEELFPWIAGALKPLMPFCELLERSARHHLADASADEQAYWVEQRLRRLANVGEPHEQALPDGSHIQITERATPDGGLVIVYHDVTALRRATAEIESLAFYDTLTGLPNRRLLLDRLTQATVSAARTGQMGALLFLDLDQFKIVNDTLGHEVGDHLLQQVGQRLKANVRDADTVARLGGDEFVVMLLELAHKQEHAAQLAQHIGDKLLHALNEPYVLDDHPYYATCSLGATLFGGAQVQSAAELLKQADIAMYQVKGQRGNALCFFDPRMQAAITERAQLEVDLRRALERDELQLHYQPQFALDGHMVGAEALLRWSHPLRGMVPPVEFITVAEDSELILPLGQWVLQTACRQLAAWRKEPRLSALELAVNVSARQFRQADFVQQVSAALLESGAPPQRLKLELTESLMLDNVDDCIAKMSLLKTSGVRFSVDDFGTGYSSLAYLTRLPLDQLKIDQSFVRNLGVRHSDGLIVQTIVGMARNLGLEVIAEGVESAVQKELLAEQGCTLYQGYLFARPAPVAVLEALMEAGPPPEQVLAA